jgi:hypothetical protein
MPGTMPLAYVGRNRPVSCLVGVEVGDLEMQAPAGAVAIAGERAAAHPVADFVLRATEILPGLFRAQGPGRCGCYHRRWQSGGELFTAEPALERRL